MSKRPVLTAILLAALATASASGQRLGGTGGTIGSVGGRVGSTVGSLGGTVGGTVRGTVGGLGGTVGGHAGGSLSQVGSGLAGTVTHVTGRAGDTISGSSEGLGRSTSRVSGSYMITGSRIAYRPRSSSSNEGSGGSLDGSFSSEASQFDLLNDLTPVTGYLHISATELLDLRRLRHEALIRANPRTLDRDDLGQPVRKGELIVVDPDDVSLAAAKRAGFRIVGVETSAVLGLRMVTLSLPRGTNVRKGLKTLRRAVPALQVDYNHVYEPAGGALLPAMGARLAAPKAVKRGTRIAMIDGGVAAHPSLAKSSIEQRGFAGNPEPTGHGTAVGSLLVGDQGPFRGVARGSQLFVADVYGGNAAAGSAGTIVRALEWTASKRPTVINISLIGPHNRTLAKAISRLRARGIQVVAAVGNDGPAAPPAFPASYPAVLAVTGVDAADHALREAGTAVDLDFAAPGADLVAALPGNGYTPVRGTSFAAPFVAARLAATGSPVVLAAEAVPGKGKVGRGIVCRQCRILPKMVGLR